jgi:hypothetical protein
MEAARKLAEGGYITAAQAQQMIRQIAEERSGLRRPISGSIPASAAARKRIDTGAFAVK